MDPSFDMPFLPHKHLDFADIRPHHQFCLQFSIENIIIITVIENTQNIHNVRMYNGGIN